MISPIKDPHNLQCGGTLKKLMPPRSTVNIPIFFSGNLAFSLTSAGHRVRGMTNKYVVYEFWKCAFHDPNRIMHIAEHLVAKQDPNILYYLQEDWPTYRDPYLRSALFFLLNRLSHSGFQSHGELTHENYNPISLNRLKTISDSNLEMHLLTEENFISSLQEFPDSDYVVIPVGNFKYNFFQEGQSKGWETTEVDHCKIRDFLSSTNKKTIAAYNKHATLPSFYRDFEHLYLNKYGTPVKDINESKEVLIANFRLS